MWGVGVWVVGCGLWGVGSGVWGVGCGAWIVGSGHVENEESEDDELPEAMAEHETEHTPREEGLVAAIRLPGEQVRARILIGRGYSSGMAFSSVGPVPVLRDKLRGFVFDAVF